MFEVREMDSDISFIRNYLTKELVQQEDLYVFEKKGSYYKISDKEYRNVQDRIIAQRVNGGFPYIVVHDGDYVRNGELYLVHKYRGNRAGCALFRERSSLYPSALGPHRPSGNVCG